MGIPSLPRKWTNLIPAVAVAFVNCMGAGRVVCASGFPSELDIAKAAVSRSAAAILPASQIFRPANLGANLRAGWSVFGTSIGVWTASFRAFASCRPINLVVPIVALRPRAAEHSLLFAFLARFFPQSPAAVQLPASHLLCGLRGCKP